ncbi:MAG: hypothetical protein KGZ42_09225, partial [Melioribacter sp.]|nr:hypothetical protein [Melioribacter sp.]
MLLYQIACYGISFVLLFSGVSKVIDPQPMLETIKAVINVSEELQIASATLLPILEQTLGVMLLLRIRVKETLVAVTILFMFFFLFSVYGLVRLLFGGTVIGLENDCGCFGKVVDSSFGIGMVIRNIFFLLLSLFVLIRFEKNPGA